MTGSEATGANWYGTRQHYAAEWRPRGSSARGGHTARALCWTKPTPVEVYDQAAVDALEAQYLTRKHVVVADLPLCKKCIRKEATRAR